MFARTKYLVRDSKRDGIVAIRIKQEIRPSSALFLQQYAILGMYNGFFLPYPDAIYVWPW